MFLKLFWLTIALANVGENNKVLSELLSASKAFEKAITSWFPEDAEFNESGLSEDCPGLTNFSLCPNDVNITVLHNVLKTAVGCMRKPICGILIDNRPTPMVTLTTEELLPGTGVDGVIATVPGTCYLANVSNIEFDFLPDNNQTHQSPKQITMFMRNIRSFGTIKFDLSLRTILPLQLGQALSVTIPGVKYDIQHEYVSVIAIGHSINGSSLNIKLQNPISMVQPVFCGLDTTEGFPNILTLITNMAQVIIGRSSWTIRATEFLEKYFKIAFRIVSKSC